MTAFNSRDGGFFLTTVGRVQTPTLSIVVEREEKIRKHVARDYWEVRATFDAQAGAVRRQVVRPDVEEEPRRPRAARRPAVERGRRRRPSPTRCRGQPASVSEESKPSTSSCPLLYDLTTLQREANSRFGFSAKTTLSIAQALYEKHKVLTYPRTDSRALPEDYVAVVKNTFEMIAKEDLPGPLRAAGGACQAGAEGRLRQADQARLRQRQGVGPLRHHPDAAAAEEPERDRGQALRPGGQALPGGVLSAGRVHGDDAHLHRQGRAKEHKFQTNGKVLVKPGWLAVYGKEAQEDDANLVAVAPGEMVRTESVDVMALKTKPPARYTEATLLSRDGRRRQADRRRRAARGHGREGPGHAGHARHRSSKA